VSARTCIPFVPGRLTGLSRTLGCEREAMGRASGLQLWPPQTAYFTSTSIGRQSSHFLEFPQVSTLSLTNVHRILAHNSLALFQVLRTVQTLLFDGQVSYVLE
jgi:hypothetical protein